MYVCMFLYMYASLCVCLPECVSICQSFCHHVYCWFRVSGGRVPSSVDPASGRLSIRHGRLTRLLSVPSPPPPPPPPVDADAEVRTDRQMLFSLLMDAGFCFD